MEAALDSKRISLQGNDLSLPLTRRGRVSMTTEGGSPAASRAWLAANQLQGHGGQSSGSQAPVSTLGPAVQIAPPMLSPFQQVQVPGLPGPQPGPSQSTSPHSQMPCSNAAMSALDDSLRKLDANLS